MSYYQKGDEQVHETVKEVFFPNNFRWNSKFWFTVCRTKDEEIQQREIDISCLRGQVEIYKILDEATSDDTLTPNTADCDFENEDVLLEDLEWDPDSSAMKLES